MGQKLKKLYLNLKKPYFKSKMKRLNSHKYNVLLVKDDVGRPKPCTRRLPSNAFTFGKAETRDPEDAGKGKHEVQNCTIKTEPFFLKTNLVALCSSDLIVALLQRISLAKAGQRLQETEQVGTWHACHHCSRTYKRNHALLGHLSDAVAFFSCFRDNTCSEWSLT